MIFNGPVGPVDRDIAAGEGFLLGDVKFLMLEEGILGLPGGLDWRLDWWLGTSDGWSWHLPVFLPLLDGAQAAAALLPEIKEIGRASCRERV